MKIEIKVPAMGESISEATVGEILKLSGSQVANGDELLELETDKVNQVLYAQQAGIVTLNVKTGDVVKIGQVIGFLDSEGSATPPPPNAQPKSEAPKKETPTPVPKPTPTPTPAPTPTSPQTPPPIQKSQPAEKTALPTSSGARISKDKFLEELRVEKPVISSTELPKEKAVTAIPGERRETRRKMTKIRQVIAKRMVEAQHNAAMLTTFNEVDMSQVMALREKYKEVFVKEHGVKLGFMSFFVKATVAALAEFPDINSYLDGDEIVRREYYDIGIAVGTDRGVIVPVVRDCDRLSFSQIEGTIDGYAKRVREGKISADDLQGGGFTITNGGVYGSLLSTPILNPPQSGILGMHKILKRAVVVDDHIVIRPMMYVALSYDHRIVDGKAAVSFLVTVKNCLEDPARLLLEI